MLCFSLGTFHNSFSYGWSSRGVYLFLFMTVAFRPRTYCCVVRVGRTPFTGMTVLKSPGSWFSITVFRRNSRGLSRRFPMTMFLLTNFQSRYLRRVRFFTSISRRCRKFGPISVGGVRRRRLLYWVKFIQCSRLRR